MSCWSISQIKICRRESSDHMPSPLAWALFFVLPTSVVPCCCLIWYAPVSILAFIAFESDEFHQDLLCLCTFDAFFNYIFTFNAKLSRRNLMKFCQSFRVCLKLNLHHRVKGMLLADIFQIMSQQPSLFWTNIMLLTSEWMWLYALNSTEPINLIVFHKYRLMTQKLL